jgi:hypothetical protein
MRVVPSCLAFFIAPVLFHANIHMVRNMHTKEVYFLRNFRVCVYDTNGRDVLGKVNESAPAPLDAWSVNHG